MTGFSEYDKYDGLGLAELVQAKEVKPIELVEEAINRIEKLNPQINAVIHKMYDLARKAAEGDLPDGPFKGAPFLLKDYGLSAAYGGVPLRNGSRFQRDFVPDHDSELVKRYKAAGVIVVGKTNVPEYALSPATEPELFGPTNNPWNMDRITGGSSGGSAAAVASCMVPLAHGNDGGGSIRIPSSCCGLFGLKPTRGRIPSGPDLAEPWHGLLIEHVLTRSVRDSAAMLDATAGPDVGAPYYAPPPSHQFLSEVSTSPGKLRIAFTSKPLLADSIHEDCVKGLETTVRLCRDLGHEMVEAAPQIDRKAFARAMMTVTCGEVTADIEAAEVLMGRKATAKDFEPATWTQGLIGKYTTAADICQAVRVLHRIARQISHFFKEYDALLTPTLSQPPLVKGALQLDPDQRALLDMLNEGGPFDPLPIIDAFTEQGFEFISFTPPFNATGQPAMSVPLYWNDEGLPIGMHFVGRYADEATLFRLAGQLEEASPWFDRLPPICS